MYSSQLTECLLKDKYTKEKFIGVLARDELPEHLKFPCCFILNTKPRNHRGEHWLAFYYDTEGKCDFFDSYGQSPSRYNLTDFINKSSRSRWFWNRKRIQGRSKFCGYYCLLFLLFRSRNKQNNFFNFFSNIYSKNDKKILNLINEFNL